jgi:predicted RNA binding protein YcfA (HicA-like mRNA interferase family)
VPKVRDAIRLIEAEGWYWVRTRGSHRQFKHRWRPGNVTIAGKPTASIPPKTWKSILRQAGLEREDQ